MLPNIHYKNRNETGDVTFFMKGDPVVGDRLGDGILEEDGPADVVVRLRRFAGSGAPCSRRG